MKKRKLLKPIIEARENAEVARMEKLLHPRPTTEELIELWGKSMKETLEQIAYNTLINGCHVKASKAKTR